MWPAVRMGVGVMLVQMLETRRVTVDGYATRVLEAGCCYDLPDFVARCLIGDGRAEAIEKPIYPYKRERERMMARTSERVLERKEPPIAEPITREEAKIYLRVDGDAEDALIDRLIEAVREAAEEYLHKSLITQIWLMRLGGYAPLCLPLAKGPVQEVLEVRIVSRNGAVNVVNQELYHLAPMVDAVHFASVVMGHAVEVEYRAGYGVAGDVPSSIKQGMLLHLAALYEDRIGGTMPAAAIALYKPHRQVRL